MGWVILLLLLVDNGIVILGGEGCTKRISRLNNDNDLLSSCVEDDGVLFDVFVDVDDGRGWARCERITDCIRDVWLVALVVRLSKSRLSAVMVKQCRASAECHINKSIACLLSFHHLQKHKCTSLLNHVYQQ